MKTETKQARVITLQESRVMKRQLPKSLYKAAGLMRHKRTALERHLRQVHEEWDRHPRS